MPIERLGGIEIEMKIEMKIEIEMEIEMEIEIEIEGVRASEASAALQTPKEASARIRARARPAEGTRVPGQGAQRQRALPSARGVTKLSATRRTHASP